MNIINTLLDINISDIESLKEYWNITMVLNHNVKI